MTDSAGLYRIVDLRPGTYTVTITLPGFSTVKRDGLELIGSMTLTVPVELKVGELQETVTVTGASPVVDVQNTRRETVISADLIQALPGTRAYGSLLNLMPGVTVDNNGLAATPTMTSGSVLGSMGRKPSILSTRAIKNGSALPGVGTPMWSGGTIFADASIDPRR